MNDTNSNGFDSKARICLTRELFCLHGLIANINNMFKTVCSLYTASNMHQGTLSHAYFIKACLDLVIMIMSTQGFFVSYRMSSLVLLFLQVKGRNVLILFTQS